jgi:hypothetical protein
MPLWKTGAVVLSAFVIVAGTALADLGKASPSPKETEQTEKKPETASPAPVPAVPTPPPVPQPPLPSNPLPLQVPPAPKVEPKTSSEKTCPPASVEGKKPAEKAAQSDNQPQPCQSAAPLQPSK